MTEFEAERERLATLMDLRLELKSDAAKASKTEFTLEEVLEAIDNYAEKVKIHK